MTENTGSRPEKPLHERAVTAELLLIKKEEQLKTCHSWNGFFAIFSFLLVGLIVFLLSINLNLRSEKLNMQDVIDDQARIIKSYKIKTND